MFYVYDSGNNRGKFYPLSLERVKHILTLNIKGEMPTDLLDLQTLAAEPEKSADYDADDLTGVIELPPEERKNPKEKQKQESKSKQQTEAVIANGK